MSRIKAGLEQDFQNNWVSVRVAAPTLVIPFEQKSWEQVYEGECWLFTMGELSFASY